MLHTRAQCSRRMCRLSIKENASSRARVFSLRCRTRCSARRQSARTRAASACAAHRPPLSCPHPSQPQRGAAPGHQLQGGSQQSRTHVSQLHTRTDTMSRGCRGRPYQPFCERRPRRKRKLQDDTQGRVGQLVPINRSSALQPPASGLMVRYTLLTLLPPALMPRCLAALLSQAPRRMTAPRSASTPQTV